MRKSEKSDLEDNAFHNNRETAKYREEIIASSIFGNKIYYRKGLPEPKRSKYKSLHQHWSARYAPLSQ